LRVRGPKEYRGDSRLGVRVDERGYPIQAITVAVPGDAFRLHDLECIVEAATGQWKVTLLEERAPQM
jgi:hypothetical protein